MSMYCMRSWLLRLAAEADERLALELEDLVLGHLARGAAGAAAEHLAELAWRSARRARWRSRRRPACRPSCCSVAMPLSPGSL